MILRKEAKVAIRDTIYRNADAKRCQEDDGHLQRKEQLVGGRCIPVYRWFDASSSELSHGPWIGVDKEMKIT